MAWAVREPWRFRSRQLAASLPRLPRSCTALLQLAASKPSRPVLPNRAPPSAQAAGRSMDGDESQAARRSEKPVLSTAFTAFPPHES